MFFSSLIWFSLHFSHVKLIALVVLIACGSFCIVNGSHHKHIIIHVPYHVKHHHHTHTIYKHVKHIDHGHDHHIHHHDHHHHDDEYKIISVPSHHDFGGMLSDFIFFFCKTKTHKIILLLYFSRWMG